MDDASANLANFDNQNIASINPNGGYGVAVHFGANGRRSSIALARHVAVSGLFDHSVTGNLSISEDAGASSRVINGSVTVYHNLVRVVGTSTFTNVIHSDLCCVPTGGEITTTFSAGANQSPRFLGELMLGKSEKLTFTGCGTAVLTETDGTVKNVTLKRCF